MAAKHDSTTNQTQNHTCLQDTARRTAEYWLNRRAGPALYTYTEHHAGYMVTCPHCGSLLLLEVVNSSQHGAVVTIEACDCGGAA